MRKTILITGATGFLGSHLLSELISLNFNIIILKRSTSKIWRIEHLKEKYISYDIDLEAINKAFIENNIDIIIHTACNYGRDIESVHEIIESNLLFGLKILELAIANGVKTFINTDTLLPRDLNSYSLSKKHMVDWLKYKSNMIKVINLKIEHIFGPKDSGNKLVPWILTQLKENKKEIKLTKGTQKRDFIFIDDIILAFLVVINKSGNLPKYTEFEVGTGKLTSVKDFIILLKKEFEEISGPTKTKLLFGEIDYRENEIMSIIVENKKLIDLGWFVKTNLNKDIKKCI